MAPAAALYGVFTNAGLIGMAGTVARAGSLGAALLLFTA